VRPIQAHPIRAIAKRGSAITSKSWIGWLGALLIALVLTVWALVSTVHAVGDAPKPDDELFERIYTKDPGLYFSSLVQLAKVLKVEVGEAGAFDNKPRSREEALRKLEERAGTDARKLFEAFLKKIDKLEAAALDAQEGEAERGRQGSSPMSART
jgi:hypothetical protein